MKNSIPTRYTLRLASYDIDSEDIVAYFADQYKDKSGKIRTRPKTVFNRTKEAFGAAIKNNMFWVLTNPDGTINATAAAHTLSGGIAIGSTMPQEKSQAMVPTEMPVSFAEIGSVWRRSDAPVGFCLELLYSACTLQTLLKAKECSTSFLVTQVVASNESGIKKLARLQQGWEEFVLRDEYRDWFRNTVPDEKSKNTELKSYIVTPVDAVLKAAHVLSGTDKDANKFGPAPKNPGVIQAHDIKTSRIVDIDLKGTNLLEVASKVIECEQELLSNPRLRTSKTSWSELHQEVFGSFSANKIPSHPRSPTTILPTFFGHNGLSAA